MYKTEIQGTGLIFVFEYALKKCYSNIQII